MVIRMRMASINLCLNIYSHLVELFGKDEEVWPWRRYVAGGLVLSLQKSVVVSGQDSVEVTRL